MNTCQDAQAFAEYNIQESLKGTACGFCEQVQVKVFTYLDLGVRDRS